MNNDKNNKPLKEITHGIIAYSLNEDKENPSLNVFHFTGYWSEPTEDDWTHLEEELNTDEEFGLVGRIGLDVFLMEASKEMIDFYKNLDYNGHEH